MDNGFLIYTSEAAAAEIEVDPIHAHVYHEVFLVLEGNIDYLIEGTVFPMKAGDMVVIGAGEPHSKYRIYGDKYKIFVMLLEKRFFELIGCPEYEDVFRAHSITEHKFSAETVKESGIYSAYKRLEFYTNGFQNTCTKIAMTVIAEILYILNMKDYSQKFTVNAHIKHIVEYINQNYRQRISLDEIAANTFLSKYYICKTFKKHMGTTVKSYITQKRLASVNNLINSGYSITAACINSGFSDYSSFYNAFVKENGKPPREMLKKN